MKTFALLSAAALVAVTLAAPPAEARGGGLAIGILGGLAAGALIGAAVADAHAAPGYGYGAPAYGYAPPPPYRAVRSDPYGVPFHEGRPVVSYERGQPGYGYGPVAHRWHGDWDRPYGYRGW